MKDFTLEIYTRLLEEALSANYTFQKFEDFVTNKDENLKTVIMRHDVDRIPMNALKIAKIENDLKIKTSYFFRIVPSVWDEDIISQVADLGHEVAYHYEDLSLMKGDYEKAIVHFQKHLEELRKFYPSKTICMHGSPMSKWDNRKLWEKYSYRDFGIIAEPYFDVNYNDIFYVTDTGRKWNNDSSNVRDKVNSGFNIEILSTFDFINKIKSNLLPAKIMINTHPHRWFDYGINWYKEYIGQNVKNVVKSLVIKYR